MYKKKRTGKVLCITAVICWIITIIPSAYVLYNAFDSMSGTTHGFNGEMLYGIDAFIDTIFMFIAFLFPLFLLWAVVFLGAIISTVGAVYVKKRSCISVSDQTNM